MPYIKNIERKHFEEVITALSRTAMSGPGELNYLFTMLIKQYLSTRSFNYQAINDVLGALEGCKTEFYERKAREYEKRKLWENGDVW